MKPGKWIYLSCLSFFFLAGTIHCTGAQAAMQLEPSTEPVPKGMGERSKEIAPEASRGAFKTSWREIAQETPMPLQAEFFQPQAPNASMIGKTFAQRLEPAPRSPQPIPPPMRPGTLPGMPPAPPVMAAPPVSPPIETPAPIGPSRRAEPPKGARFVLNFDNADIYEVIRVMAEMMGINYVIDPRVKGVVNIRTTGQISTQDIFPIFQTILKMNGATAVQKGIVYEIVPFGEAKKLFIPPTVNRVPGRSQEERYTIQILSLRFIPATEASKIIKPFLSDGADIVEHPLQNLLVVGDLSSNIQKVVSIMELFDVDIFSDTRVRIYPILNADVNEVAKEMERIFSSLEVSLKSGRGVGITFTPITRINSLLAVSSIPGVFEKVERWVKELDRIPGEGTQLNVFVYYVQNGKAKDLAEVLKQVYVPIKGAKPEGKEKATAPTSTSGTPTAPGPRGVRPSPATPSTGPGSAREESGGVPEGEISIVVDDTTNSLIIRAYHRDYRAILDTIRKLDIYPKQVLIEVLLAEVTLDDSVKYGLEWSTFSDSFTKGGRTYSYTVGAGGIAPQTDMVSGLRYAITSVDRLAAAISASASEDRLKVIGSPHVLASNNKEARIQIGQSQPILTNTYTTTGTTSPGVVEGTIEYKDVGIILTVTPRISDSKLVTLDISVESSTVGQTALGNLTQVPFFPKKTAKTTLSIMEKETIVIGGLIEDRKEAVKTGIPYLSKIPVLGALFGWHANTVSKTETVIFLTPRVIGDLADSNRVTEEIREKVFTIQKELEKLKKEKEKEKGKEKGAGSSKIEPAAPRVGAAQSRPATEFIAP
jgi:general secretion pathway protein D